MVSMLCGCHHHRQHQQHFGSDNLLCSKHHEECGKCVLLVVVVVVACAWSLQPAACSGVSLVMIAPPPPPPPSISSSSFSQGSIICCTFCVIKFVMHFWRRLGLGLCWIITIVFSFSLSHFSLALPHSIAGRCCALTHMCARRRTRRFQTSNTLHLRFSSAQLSSAPQVHSRVTRQVFTLVFTVSLNHVRSL